jgi:hypothetical protein
MIDHDLIGLTMHEAQRLSAEPVGPNNKREAATAVRPERFRNIEGRPRAVVQTRPCDPPFAKIERKSMPLKILFEHFE